MSVPSTLLAIDGVEIGDYASRALSMTMSHLDQAKQIFRTINGRAVDFSASQFQKYKASIKCGDQESPVLAGVWPGKIVTVLTLSQITGPDPIYMEMIVTGWSSSRENEWSAQTTWTLELEEV